MITYTGEFTTTTTGNIDDLDFLNAAVIRMNNASLATLRGLKAGVGGQRVTIVSIGAGTVMLPHQNAGSTAANRLINAVTSGSTPLAAGTGSATYQYDATTARWRLVSHIQGAPIAVAYDAANFTASVGTWGVDLADQLTYEYVIKDGLMWFSWSIVNTNVTNASILRMAIPGGFTAVKDANSFQRVIDAGTGSVAGLCRTLAASNTRVEIFPTAGGGFWTVTAANDTGSQGSFWFGVT